MYLYILLCLVLFKVLQSSRRLWEDILLRSISSPATPTKITVVKETSISCACFKFLHFGWTCFSWDLLCCHRRNAEYNIIASIIKSKILHYFKTISLMNIGKQILNGKINLIQSGKMLRYPSLHQWKVLGAKVKMVTQQTIQIFSRNVCFSATLIKTKAYMLA